MSTSPLTKIRGDYVFNDYVFKDLVTRMSVVRDESAIFSATCSARIFTSRLDTKINMTLA